MGRVCSHVAGHTGEDSCMQSSSEKFCVRLVRRDILYSHNLAVIQLQLYNRSSIQPSRKKEEPESGVPMPKRVVREGIPEWAAQITKFKEHLRLTQQAFAAKLGVSQAIVSSWQLGKKEPRSEMYFKMIRLSPTAEGAAFLMKRAVDISGSYQIEGLEKMLSSQKKPARSSQGARFAHLSSEVAEIPLLRDPAAAGTPRQMDEREIDQVIPFSKSLCPNPADTVCIKIAGDSMSPMLLDGYIAAVDIAQRDPVRLINAMVAARGPEGGVTVKWLRKVGKDLILIPQNTSKRHQPVILTRDGDEGTESQWGIVGKVLWWIGQPS
jgi:SOS-response transcriptional repressor LexA/DNA-binding transcriptional regulator YiaG